ncbi:MAG: NPXTG-anchored protein [Oscillospiraceae bacterium]|nr:NPXTG-anchored protein [Oscillospiraceae bacterium]
MKHIKKLLAAILAGAMCLSSASMALAEDNSGDYTDTEGVQDLELTFTMVDDLDPEDLKASISWDDGKTYYDDVDIDDNSAGEIVVTISFKDYYGVDDLDIDFDLSIKKGSTSKYFSAVALSDAPANGGWAIVEEDQRTTDDAYKTVNVSGSFGWGWIDSDSEDTDDAELVVGDSSVIFDDDDITFGTFTFENMDEVEYAVKMSKQDAVNMYVDSKVTDEIKSIMKKYESADISVLNFKGNPDFDFTGTLTYYVEDEDEDYYFYEIEDGKVVSTAAKYDDDDACFTLKTRTLGTYIISDTKLSTTSTSDEETADTDADTDTDTSDDTELDNPETGSVDFVNAAVALGVVSLVAAGAMLIRKK